MNFSHNYEQEIKIIPMVKANLISLILILPSFLLLGIPYILVWDFGSLSQSLLESFHPFAHENGTSFILEFVYLGLGVIAHELIHGLTWAFFAKSGFKSIKFGVFWRMLSPYCHCSEPLKLNNYKIGILMPTFIVALIPGIISIILGNPDLLTFSAFMLVVSSGDFLIYHLLRNESKDAYFLDHPIECGGILLKPKHLNNKR